MTTQPSPPAKIKLVVAGSFTQYLDWCDENQIDPKNHRAKYVRRAEDLRGYNAEGAELVTYGTWYKRDDGMVEAVLEFRGMEKALALSAARQ